MYYYKPGLSNTHCHTLIRSSLQPSAKQCLLQRYLFEESSLQIRQLMLSLMLLQSEIKTVVHISKLFVEIISQTSVILLSLSIFWVWSLPSFCPGWHGTRSIPWATHTGLQAWEEEEAPQQAKAPQQAGALEEGHSMNISGNIILWFLSLVPMQAVV